MSKQEPARLRLLMERYKQHGYEDLAQACLVELQSRGAATRNDFAHLAWNRETVNRAMEPFAEIARSVEGNARTAFTEAGGTKIGKPKDDPARNWIDTYCGIKRGNVNATFVCYVKAPGDDPRFEIQANGNVKAVFTANQLEDAIKVWRDIAERA